MVRADGTDRSHSASGWIISMLLLVGGACYISLFWGQTGQHLPEPLHRWWLTGHDCWLWCYRNVRSHLGACPAPHLVTDIIFGVVLPAIVVMLCRLKPIDVGIGLPNALGRRLIVISVIVAVPFGLWLVGAMELPDDQPLLTWETTCNLLRMVPEHFLICGIFVACLLPGRRLPAPVPIAPTEGSIPVRALRWLGLAQPVPASGGNRLAAWFGLTGGSFFAIMASGCLFGMVHVGKDIPELICSFPGGVAVAYVTLRSHSIWPAILAHWAMNLIPLAFFALFQ